jgi:hypothetical protein
MNRANLLTLALAFGALAAVPLGATHCSSTPAKLTDCQELCKCDSTKCSLTDEKQCTAAIDALQAVGKCVDGEDGGTTPDSGGGDAGSDVAACMYGPTVGLKQACAVAGQRTACCQEPYTCYFGYVGSNPDDKVCCADTQVACNDVSDCCQTKSSNSAALCENGKCCSTKGNYCKSNADCCSSAPTCNMMTMECQ